MRIRTRMHRPSGATVISLVALFVALGGTAFAAVTITGRDVKNGSLTGKDIRSNSISGRDITDRSLHDVASARTLSTKKLRIRTAQTVIGGNTQNENWNSGDVAVSCGRGEVAISAGTQWIGPTENLELATQYSRLTVDSKGKPRGAIAGGIVNIPGPRVFQVQVLCAGG
jgi:hypothetical protein